MADYRDRLDEWREAARRKARDLDEKYNIRERVEESARAAGEAAKRGADAVKTGAERAREEAGRLGDELDINEHAVDARERTREAREQAARAAEEAARLAREVGGRVGDAGQRAGERAEDFIGGAKKYYKGAARAAGLGVRATRLTAASTAGLYRAYDWARQNPKQAIAVTLSLAAGVRAGAAFPGLDGVLLGAHPHWFTHSALPVWAVRKVSQKFDDYLRERERLVAAAGSKPLSSRTIFTASS